MAVGSPAPTSRANVGPDSTAHRARRTPAPRARPDAAACRCRLRSPWSPTRRACSADRCGASSLSSARRRRLGTTTSTSRAPASAAGRSAARPPARRERRCRQVARVAALARHALELRASRPHSRTGAAAARELDRERRAPGARAEHGDRRQRAAPLCSRACASPQLVVCGRLLLVGGVQRVEVDRRQQELREAALADELR